MITLYFDITLSDTLFLYILSGLYFWCETKTKTVVQRENAFQSKIILMFCVYSPKRKLLSWKISHRYSSATSPWYLAPSWVSILVYCFANKYIWHMMSLFLWKAHYYFHSSEMAFLLFVLFLYLFIYDISFCYCIFHFCVGIAVVSTLDKKTTANPKCYAVVKAKVGHGWPPH